MKKLSQREAFANPVLLLAYWYHEDGEKDACVFIGDDSKKADPYDEQFLIYANKFQDWNVKEDDIIDVFAITEEQDKNGNYYKLKI